MPSSTPAPGYLDSSTIRLVSDGMANVVMDATRVIEAVLPAGLVLIGMVLAVRLCLRFFRMFGRA